MPRICVLMPVYNGLPYIREAVDSVFAQDCQDWELVVSDNCSTDGTRDYLDALNDPRIRVFKQATNLGIFGNLNFLLRQASIPIAKILCADDVLLPEALGRVAHFMEERPSCAVSRCYSQHDVKRLMRGSRVDIGVLPTNIVPSASILAFAAFGNLVGNLSQSACRPSLVLQAGGFDQQYPYAGDYEGWMRVSARFGLQLQNEKLVIERTHDARNAVLLNQNNEVYAQINSLIERFATLVGDSDLSILKRHWIIHFFAPRLSRVIRQLIAGQLNLARIPLNNLPLGMSAASVISAYPLWKFNLPPARATTRRLFRRILELNAAEP